MSDLLYALRRLRNRPGFTLFVVATLALGIGAATILFSLVQAIYLRPLPYPEPDELLSILSTTDGERRPVSYLDFRDFQRELSSFRQVEAFDDSRNLPLTGDRMLERVRVSFISGGFFDLLGQRALHGRLLGAEDEQAPHAVISHGLWQRRFGGDGAVVGSPLRLAGNLYTVVGVLPEDFVEFSPEAATDVFLPVATAGTLFSPGYLDFREHHWLRLVGRLAEGRTVADARAETATLAARLERQYPRSNTGIGSRIDRLRDYAFDFRNLDAATWILGAAAALLLAIACVNVGNLMLVRALERGRELAVRRALGASGRQLLRQLLTESVLLALLGGLLGIVLSVVGTRVLVAWSPLPLPPYLDVGVDPGVLAACLVLSLLVGLAVGLVPAARTLRAAAPFAALRSGTRTIDGAAGAPQRLLVVVQVTLAVLPLIGAGLLLRSFQLFDATGYGFDTDNLLTARVQLSLEGYPEDGDLLAFQNRIQDAGLGLPGVKSAHLWGPGRAGDSHWTRDVLPEGRDGDQADELCLFFEHRVTEGALKDLGIALLDGRAFDSGDAIGGEPVALISRSLAESCWKGQDAVGQRFRRGTRDDLPWVTVVGVVEDARHRGRGLEAVPHDAYYLLRQMPTNHLTLMLQTEVEPTTLIAPLRAALASVDPDVPLFDIATLDELRSHEANENRFYALLMSAYSASALLLVSLGIFSVLSYVVEQRKRELGIREAMGARRRDLLVLVGGQMLRLLCVGLVLGVVCALAGTRVMRAMLYRVDALDPATFLLAPTLLLAVGLLACTIPARRALASNPVEALKGD